VVSFSDGLDDFIWRLRVEAAPRVLRTARPMIELGSGTGAAQGLPPEEGTLRELQRMIDPIITGKSSE